MNQREGGRQNSPSQQQPADFGTPTRTLLHMLIFMDQIGKFTMPQAGKGNLSCVGVAGRAATALFGLRRRAATPPRRAESYRNSSPAGATTGPWWQWADQSARPDPPGWHRAGAYRSGGTCGPRISRGTFAPGGAARLLRLMLRAQPVFVQTSPTFFNQELTSTAGLSTLFS